MFLGNNGAFVAQKITGIWVDWPPLKKWGMVIFMLIFPYIVASAPFFLHFEADRSE